MAELSKHTATYEGVYMKLYGWQLQCKCQTHKVYSIHNIKFYDAYIPYVFDIYANEYSPHRKFLGYSYNNSIYLSADMIIA